MLTALIILSIAIGLKQLGVEMPFVDKVINFAETKLEKLKGKKGNLVNKDIHKSAEMVDVSLKDKKSNTNIDLNPKPYQTKNNPKIYSGSLKI